MPIVCDVRGVTEPDKLMLDALARLQLAAARRGTSILLVNASLRLVDLIAAAGLADVLKVSGVEMDG